MQVSRWGNSLAVRLPKALVDQLGLKEGDEFSVVAVKPGTIEVETREAQRRRAQLDAPRRLPVRPRRGQRAVSAFLATNILVYAQQTRPKADRSRALLAQGGKLSVQVPNEFTAVARRKLQHDWADISDGGRSRRC
jgi:antitoxin component of MazEF toxin-antitoxin module